MRILFCNPPTLDGEAFVREGRCEHRAASFQYLMAPISLPSCAALALANGHEVQLIDCIAEEVSLACLLDAVERSAPDLIVLAVTTTTFEGDAEVSRALRQRTTAHLTAIGVHVTALPEESLRSSALDSVVRGEPEVTVAHLADALASSRPLAQVAGIAFRDGGEIVVTPERPPIEDLDSLPWPARDLLHNELYVAPLSDVPQTPLMPARGCPYDCIYCTASCYYGSRVRVRSAVNVVDEMQECVEVHGIPEILMWADTFTANRRFVLEVCEEIRARDLHVRWICNSRVDTVDPELLRAMAGAGCWAVAYGIESGSQVILDRARKRTTLDQARDAIRWTREAGLTSMAHVVVGLPGESAPTIEATVAFLREVSPDYIQVYNAVPFPGSDLFDLALDEGWLPGRAWSAFEQNRAYMRTEALTAEELERGRRRVLRSFYLRPGYVLKRLSEVRSPGDLYRLAAGAWDFTRRWASSA
jgi:radical SAM superfamily enzyme YgiQ (UPF0313 family)